MRESLEEFVQKFSEASNESLKKSREILGGLLGLIRETVSLNTSLGEFLKENLVVISCRISGGIFRGTPEEIPEGIPEEIFGIIPKGISRVLPRIFLQKSLKK